MTETRARQQSHLGQGLALGAILLGIESVHGSKTTLEFDFRRAWRSWPHRDRYPSIKAGPKDDEVFRVMATTVRRQGPVLAWWEGSWPFVPVIEDTWTPKAVAKILDDHVAASAWRSLVADWIGTAD